MTSESITTKQQETKEQLTSDISIQEFKKLFKDILEAVDTKYILQENGVDISNPRIQQWIEEGKTEHLQYAANTGEYKDVWSESQSIAA